MTLEPGGLIAWILLGLLAGWIAGKLTSGRGFGCIGNIAVGLIGAVIGGFIFSTLGIHGLAGFWGSLIIAVVGAAALLVVVNIIAD
ncbi:MAG TPA: GlsB/YeaQ/YmgE family stress response membrane protein [Nitrolancea sp.]|nr:GlsB/YeaQ/YmgE family stress response membrane protein [Nitrolancea sp.]